MWSCLRFSFGTASLEDLGGDGGEIEGLALVEAALAAGEGEQRFDQPFLLLADDEDALAGFAERVGRRVGVGERDLDEGALVGEWGAQLVRGVGDELALGIEGGFEAAEEPVDGVRKLLELVVGALEREPSVQVAGRDVTGGVGDRSQGAERSPCDEPAEPDRQDRHDRQGDPGLEGQLAQRCCRLALR